MYERPPTGASLSEPTIRTFDATSRLASAQQLRLVP